MSIPPVVIEPLDSPDMKMTPGERLREARKKYFPNSGRSAALAHGWTESTYNSHERAGLDGGKTFDFLTAAKYGRAFGVSPIWLLHGVNASVLADPPRPRMVKLVGTVGAGDVGHFYDVGQDDQELVEAPAGCSEKTVAVRVKGHSMEGVAEDGSLLFYDDEPSPPHEGMIGFLCVAGLADGRVLFKKLGLSPKPGLFNLISSNGGTVMDVEVVWAVRIKSIQLY